MQCFDVLIVVTWAGSCEVSRYHVVTVEAKSAAAARSAGRSALLRRISTPAKTPLLVRIQGTAPSGTYARFAGKYVGQFIDEALCR